jgi:hypothetical protein
VTICLPPEFMQISSAYDGFAAGFRRCIAVHVKKNPSSPKSLTIFASRSNRSPKGGVYRADRPLPLRPASSSALRDVKLNEYVGFREA